MTGPVAEARQKRLNGDKAGALALLDAAAKDNPKDASLQAERGLLALDLGQVKKAETVLRAAIDAKSSDWRVQSGLGAALSAQGRQQDAQLHFAKALELTPDNPGVLNNLALSYALDGKPAEAERILKRVAQAGGPHAARAKQNLALLAGLGGRREEAERIAASALPADQAKANAAMLARSGEKPAAEAPVEPKQRSSDAGGSAPQRSASVFDAATAMRLGAPRD